MRTPGEANRVWWNERVPLHAESDFYDVEAFKAGNLTLMNLEREELGDVRGKSLLHLRVHYPYFHDPQPLRFEEEGSYASEATCCQKVTYEWFHSLSDVVNALILSGLRIEFLHEFPYACYRIFPFLEQDDEGWWRLEAEETAIPMTFSLKAFR
jgi:hypothetical protein